MAKICKKHKKEFYGLRCPLCTAPPVLHPPDEDNLPFPVVTSSETSDNKNDDENPGNR